MRRHDVVKGELLMVSVNAKRFDAADEIRTPDKTRIEVVDLGDGRKVGRMTAQPGWRWSD